MSEPAVLFVKPGAIKPEDKAALRDAGVVVVEVENPDDVRLVRAEGILGAQELPHGDLLAAAASAIYANSNTAMHFGIAVAQAILAKASAGSTEGDG